MMLGAMSSAHNLLTKIQSNRSVLIVEPFPSVLLDHSWSISNRAKVVEDFGIAPNWLGLRLRSTAGFTCSVMIKSSATLEKLGVKKI